MLFYLFYFILIFSRNFLEVLVNVKEKKRKEKKRKEKKRRKKKKKNFEV